MDGPRERLTSRGAEALADVELLAILLGTGRAGQSVVSLAADLLRRGGGLAGLAKQSSTDLCKHPGIGAAKAARLAAAFEVGVRAGRWMEPEAPLTDSQVVYERYGKPLANSPVERFWVVAVDAKNRPRLSREVARGGRISCEVDPAEVFRALVAEAATGAIFIHNHPSGDPTPSPEDLALTERLVAAGALLEIRILDHLVIGQGRYTSLRDSGLWPIIPARSGT